MLLLVKSPIQSKKYFVTKTFCNFYYTTIFSIKWPTLFDMPCNPSLINLRRIHLPIHLSILINCFSVYPLFLLSLHLSVCLSLSVYQSVYIYFDKHSLWLHFRIFPLDDFPSLQIERGRPVNFEGIYL